MADRYWVGGAGTWNNASTTNWSTSSGGAGGASVPTTADNVIFDNGSDAGTIYTVTIGTGAACANWTITTQDFTLSFSGTAEVTIAGNMAFSASASFTNFTGNMRFTSTGSQTVNSGGNNLYGHIYFDGVGGTWTLQASISNWFGSSKYFYVVNGTFDTNGFSVTSTGVDANNTNTRTISLGASTLNIVVWNMGTGTNLTLNAGTSSITATLSGATSFYGGGKTYNNVSLVANYSGGVRLLDGSNTMANLTLGCGTGSTGCVFFRIGGDQTITGTFTVNTSGALRRRLVLCSTNMGTVRTITAAAKSGFLYTDFRDITIAGAIAPLTGTALGDRGNNSGITFPAAVTYYYVSTTSQNWTATVWATSSGGTPAAGNFPLPQDSIIFDNAGVTAGISMSPGDFYYQFRSFDSSSCTNAFTLAISTQAFGIERLFKIGSSITITSNNAYGVYFLPTGSTPCEVSGTPSSSSGYSAFVSSAASSITRLIGNFSIKGTGAVINDGYFYIYSGTLDLNEFALQCNILSWNPTFAFGSAFFLTPRDSTVDFGSTGTGQISVVGTNTGGTAVEAGSTINTATVIGTGKVVTSYNGNKSITINPATLDTTAVRIPPISVTGSLGTLTVTTSGFCGSLDLTGYTGTLAATSFSMTGNLSLSSGMTVTAGGTLTFIGAASTKTITSNTKVFGKNITIDCAGATTQLADALDMSSYSLTLTNGTFDANNKNISCGGVASSNTNSRTLTMGSGTWTLVSSGTVWDFTTSTNLTVNANTSTILMSNNTNNAKNFYGGGKTYNILTLGGTTGGGIITFSGDNTFTTLESTKTVAFTLSFTSGSTTTVTNWTIKGTSGNVVTIQSTVAASSATLFKSSGGPILGLGYLSIKDSAATPPNVWYAGTTSTDVSGNTGWIFTDVPTGNFLMLF